MGCVRGLSVNHTPLIAYIMPWVFQGRNRARCVSFFYQICEKGRFLHGVSG